MKKQELLKKFHYIRIKAIKHVVLFGLAFIISAIVQDKQTENFGDIISNAFLLYLWGGIGYWIIAAGINYEEDKLEKYE